MKRTFVVLSCLLPLAGAEEKPDRQLDRTGVNWVIPYTAAVKQARERKRLIMVPIIAGGSQPNGCW